MATLIKESIWLKLAYGSMHLIDYAPGEKHGGMQAHMGADSSTSRSKGSEKQVSLCLEWAFWNLKAVLQLHTS